MILVEINSIRNNAFCFKTFKGSKALESAIYFCKTLPAKCITLKANIVNKEG